MQPWFEAVSIPFGQSCLIYDRQLPEFAFNWHYHPECELTLTLGGRGTRFVGGHVAPYGDGDLVLLGPNLPHAWQSVALTGASRSHRAIVCWFTRAWIDALCTATPELATLLPLIAAAGRGLAFGQATVEMLRPRILELSSLTEASRVVALQSILCDLSIAADRRELSTGATAPDILSKDRRRMDHILSWLHAHHNEPIRLAPLCEIAHVTQSQLQRIFKRSTRMSVSDYVTRLRVGRACTLLMETSLPIAVIGVDCGFSDAAHLSRKFSAATGRTPSRYRKEFRSLATTIPSGKFPMAPRSKRGEL